MTVPPQFMNASQVLDDVGRNALHVAASAGKNHLTHWLLKSPDVQVNGKDLESGYSALHRSLFCGHIPVAITLLKVGQWDSSL